MRLPTEEVAGILEQSTPWFRPLVALAAFAGLGPGEAGAVQVGDVDFLRRTPTVARQVQWAAGGEVEVRLPKYGSERTVYLADGLVERWPRRWRRELWPTSGCSSRRPAVAAPEHGRAPMAPRLPAGRGRGLDPARPRALLRLGTDRRRLRRRHCSTRAGHAKATTTLNTYAHLWPTAEHRTRRAAGELFVQTLGTPADRPRTGEVPG